MGIVEGSEVKLVVLDFLNFTQQWEIGKNDDSGYFTIKNPTSGKFLTSHAADKIRVESVFNEVNVKCTGNEIRKNVKNFDTR